MLRHALLGSVVAALLAVSVSGVQAQDGFTLERVYVGVGGGITLPGDQDAVGEGTLNSSGFVAAGSARFPGSYDTGFVGAARIGAGFANGFRLEGEIAYRTADNDLSEIVEVCATGVPCASFNLNDIFPLLGATGAVDITGQTDVLSGMANALYDFDIDSFITPYVGVGLGVAMVDTNVDVNVNFASPGLSGGGSVGFDGADTAFAGQLIAGANIALGEGVSAALDYRYFRAFIGDISHLDVGVNLTDGVDFLAANGSLGFEGDYESHEFMLWLVFDLY